jgi:hypothetical protein
MSEQTSGVREKINIFKIGDLWCFKYYFSGSELFKDLSGYYNRAKYRFELKNTDERDRVIKYLEENGFATVQIEDTSDYVVTIDRFKKYAPILRNSIDSTEKEKERTFIMKDLASVEEAIANGAKKVSKDIV